MQPVAAARAPAVAAPSIPCAAHFHPTLPAQILVCGSAAAAWAAATADPGATLSALHRHGANSLILSARGSEDPCLAAAVRTFPGAIWRTPLSEGALVATLRAAALDHMLDTSPAPTLHGVLLEVLGLGVLIRGDSGAGKSELALGLLARGHRLVADDAVELHRLHRRHLRGRCPPLLRGFIEAHGLGILDVPAMYGPDAVAACTRLDLIVELCPGESAEDDGAARLHGRRGTCVLLGEALPTISLVRRLGHNPVVLVEAACRDHWLRLGGYRADVAFIARQRQHIATSTQPSSSP